ncbi:MAG: purine-nucleoside phosphorylase [Gemmatimonadetes bacterium]|nr:purine-nucleoside phosphorylase [Gemmatimonadota bacterium]
MSAAGGGSSPDIARAAAALRARIGGDPEVAIVLGSGLGQLATGVRDPVVVPFTDVPGFPPAGVVGHAGEYVFGTLGGRQVLLQSGRFHVYEGHPLDVVAAPVRVAAALGVRFLILTNAAGGVNPGLEPGDVVLVEDHLNLMFRSPLIGSVHGDEDRFPTMDEAYDAELRRIALAAAGTLDLPLHRGVYAALTGPSYETAAEVRMLGRLGADVVGMSTVPEVLTARAIGLRCLAFSMVTNKGTGLSDVPLTHVDVLEVGARAGRLVARLVEAVVAGLPDASQSTGAK